MKFMMIVKANKDSEAGVMPSDAELATMAAYNEKLVKAGVMLDDLLSADKRPRTLFEDSQAHAKRDRLLGALDDINGRFGKFTAVPGVQGFERNWRLRSERKSPAWTTRIDEVPRVRAG